MLTSLWCGGQGEVTLGIPSWSSPWDFWRRGWFGIWEMSFERERVCFWKLLPKLGIFWTLFLFLCPIGFPDGNSHSSPTKATPLSICQTHVSKLCSGVCVCVCVDMLQLLFLPCVSAMLALFSWKGFVTSCSLVDCQGTSWRGVMVFRIGWSKLLWPSHSNSEKVSVWGSWRHHTWP